MVVSNLARRGLLAATTAAMALGQIPRAAAAATAPRGWVRRDLRFPSHGDELAGVLFRPRGIEGRLPAIVLVGPFGFVKEQAPMQYATRLAELGYACLVFDPRGSGESGGMPRRYENPTRKMEDVRAALDFLAADPGVEASRIAGLGICQGASHMILAAAVDPRIRVVATVSGQYLYAENLAGFFGGGGPTLEDRIARGRAAQARQAAGGAVEYIAVIHPTDRSVALPWPQIHDWYARWDGVGWGDRTRWENRVTAISDAEVWTVDVRIPAARLTVPTLIVHGEFSDGFAPAAQAVFDRLTMTDRRLVIVPGVFHTRFYDDPVIIDGAVDELALWYGPRV